MQEMEALSNPIKVRRLTTILAIDICGYSSMSERDEARAISLSDITHKYFLEIVEQHNGRIFNRIADAFLAEFSSPLDGIKTALALLKRLETHNYSHAKPDEINIRMGLHVGDITDRENGDILGHGVNIAVRLQQSAHVNTVLVSSNIVNLLHSNEDFKFHDKAQISLKNITQPITVYTLSEKTPSLLDYVQRRVSGLKKIGYLIAALACAIFMFTYINSRTQQPTLTAQDVINKYFEDNASGNAQDSYSTDYLRYVLDNLRGSNIDSERASFELLRSGNISGAIENLDTYRRSQITKMRDPLRFDDPEHIALLHQLAALSYHHDPSKAESYYKAILIARPDDARAQLWLARAQNQKGEGIEADGILSQINDADIVNVDDLFQLGMDKAFNHLVRHDFEAGLNDLQALETDSQHIKNPRLILEWKTNMAIALERLQRLHEAEPLVSEVINELNRIGADTNMPRAYNVWGQIYEQRAFATTPPDQGLLRTALDKYEQQYRYGESLNKDSELGESLHYSGAVHIALGELNLAREKYSRGLLQGEKSNIERQIVRSQIGLAYLELLDGERAEACRMQSIISQTIEQSAIPLRPRNTELLNRIIVKCEDN